MLRVENLCAAAGGFELRDISLSVPTGAYMTVVGPSGAGKSLLLETVAGIRKASSGRVEVCGKDITRLPPEKRMVGFVPQDYALFPFLNVEQNILFGAKKKLPGDCASSEIVKLLNIAHLLKRDSRTLSGGERQRVAIARALAASPAALCMDEPFSALDEGLRYKLWLEMKKIHASLQTTVLHVTHDLEEAFILSDRVAVMMDGTIAQQGSREEIFYQPKSARVAEFVGIRNIFNGVVKETDRLADCTVVRVKDNVVRLPFSEDVSPGQKISFCVRSQDIKLLKSHRDVRDSLKDNVFNGRVVDSIPHGNDYTLFMRIDNSPMNGRCFDFEIKIPIHAYLKNDMAVGKEIRVGMLKRSLLMIADDN